MGCTIVISEFLECLKPVELVMTRVPYRLCLFFFKIRDIFAVFFFSPEFGGFMSLFLVCARNRGVCRKSKCISMAFLGKITLYLLFHR